MSTRLNRISTHSSHQVAQLVFHTAPNDHEEQSLTHRQGALDGLWIFERPTYHDERGFFHEAFRARDLEHVLHRSVSFLQINHSRSKHNVLRGLHAENWDKLVYVPRGEVFTALADLRPNSSSFGKTAVFRLGETSPLTLFIPAGIAHGYHVLGDEADYVYQVTAYYDGSDTRAVAWDDPDLAVPWLTHKPILSDRDKTNPTMRQMFPDAFESAPKREPILVGSSR